MLPSSLQGCIYKVNCVAREGPLGDGASCAWRITSLYHEACSFPILQSLKLGLISLYMKTLALLVIHFLTTLAQRAGPGGAKAIIAESVLLKHQQLNCTSLCRKNAKTDHIRQIPLRLSHFIHACWTNP